MKEDWVACCFGDLLDYEQPTKYIVNSTKYHDKYKTPVLTAGKTIIKCYTHQFYLSYFIAVSKKMIFLIS